MSLTDTKEIQAREEPSTSVQNARNHRQSRWKSSFWQFLRYCIVGGANTSVDLLVLNSIVWRFPTNNAQAQVLYNSIAYISGALSSFFLNKYWTFRRTQKITSKEVVRFTISLVLEVLYSNALIWLAGKALQPFITNPILWVNASKFTAIAGLLLLGISFSWITAVDLTPASQRPYVDSTTDNSELTLALGYNGIDRLIGNIFGGKRGLSSNTFTSRSRITRTDSTSSTTGNGGAPIGTPPTNGNGGPTNTGNTAGRQIPPGGGGPGGLFDTGAVGPLRLFQESLGSQVSWLLPIALLGMLALAWQRRPRFKEDLQQKSLILWGMWLLTMGIFFSVAGFFHQYYMTEMAPAIAALFGIGLVIMWKDFRNDGRRGWLLPLALVATGAEQVYLLSAYPTWSRWMVPIIVVLSIVAVGVLVGARIAPRLHVKAPSNRFLLPALSTGVLALMLAPMVWTITPILLSKQADTLVAGPPQIEGFGGNFGGGRGNTETANANAKLISYLEANQGQTEFLVAVPSSKGIADQLIIQTNKPVMSLGGFSGSDPILTTNQLESLVANGTVRFFLLNSFGRRQITSQMPNQLPAQLRKQVQQALQNGRFAAPGAGFGESQQASLTTWVTQHCKTVPTNLWQSASSGSGTGGGFGGASQLYDCAAAH